VHTAAYDRSGTAGQAFFTFGPTGITVNAALLADPTKVAASSLPGGSLDGSAAQSIAGLKGATAAYQDVVVRIGVEAQAATRRSQVQDGVVKQVDASRESGSGVNVDEEMTNMLAAQRAYQAAARYVNAVDETLDTLVNRLGLVGR
jgi:flagellar hook-associated protein 1 FlgK